MGDHMRNSGAAIFFFGIFFGIFFFLVQLVFRTPIFFFNVFLFFLLVFFVLSG